VDKIFDTVASPLTGRALVLALVVLPFLAALLLPRLGRSARRLALVLALLHLGVTAAVVLLGSAQIAARAELANAPRDRAVAKFQPGYVPGDTAGRHGEDNRTGWTLLSLAPPTSGGKAGGEVQFFLGIDGLNLWLAALASVMLIPAVLVSWESVTDRPGSFYGWLFLLQGAAVGAFLSFDVILFYAFFELTLIPAFFLIGRWGTGSGRRDAARKFFLYTLAGSLLTLVGVIGVVLTNPDPVTGQATFSLPDLMGNVAHHLDAAQKEAQAGKPEKLAALQQTQGWLFLALMAGFLVKVPVWPFHTWLPAAYSEAPIGVTVLLSALLAKLGTFGIVRFVLPLTPDAALMYGLPVVGLLAAFGIVYGALCAYDQKDMRLTVAYSSVSHLGFLVLGVFAFNAEGLSGATLHMVNHGLSTGAMFALLGFLLDRYRTTQAGRFGGLIGRFPNFAVFFFLVALAGIGLPGLNNFVSEMLMLAGLFDARNPGTNGVGLAVVAAVGIFLSAWYVLTMLRRVFFNPSREPEPAESATPPADVTRREFFAFGIPAGLCVVLGLFPQPVLDTIRPDARVLVRVGDKARERVYGLPVPAEPVEPPAPPKAPAPKPKDKKEPAKKVNPKKDVPKKDAKKGAGEDEE
jgi:NADH-quinone oxidoreductase subunit M